MSWQVRKWKEAVVIKCTDFVIGAGTTEKMPQGQAGAWTTLMNAASSMQMS